MKQAEANPWERVAEKYPPGAVVEGKVRNLTNYGAFVEIEEGIDGLLHVSDLSWTKKVGHPSEVLKKGERVQVRRPVGRPGEAAHRAGPQADARRPVDERHPRQLPSRAWWSRATSRRSPTSACSWN